MRPIIRDYGQDTNKEPYWDTVKRIIAESDLVLEIIDARLVELSRNAEVERLIHEFKRPFIYVINKSDLVKKEALRKSIENFPKDSDIIFVSNKNKKSYKILLSKIRETFKKYGKRKLPTKTGTAEGYPYRLPIADIIVGVLGYPNVGKSSVINGLAHKKKVKVSKKAGTTHGSHWIKISEDIKLIDSPGVIPLTKDDDLKYGLIGAKDLQKIKDPDAVAYGIIQMFIKNNKEAFEKYFDIKITKEEEEDINEIIDKIGIKNSYLLKKGIIDENRVYQKIIRDWQQGKLRI